MAETEIDETTETSSPAPIVESGGIVTRADGSGTSVAPTDWRASLPLELQAEPTLARYKSVEEALKGAVHAQRVIGKGLEFPGADAKPEQVAEFRKKAGVPESPDKYGITMPTAPEGQTWDAGKVNAFLGRMHAVHARPEVVQAVIDTFAEMMAQDADDEKGTTIRESRTKQAEYDKVLSQTWGPRDGLMWRHKQGNVLTSIDGLMQQAPPEQVAALKQAANENPYLADALADMAPNFTSQGFMGEAEQGTTFSAGDAAAKADALREAAVKDPKHPLNDPTHPEHERVVAEYLSYHARMVGPRGREVVAEVRK